jgi:hypothetical protein
LRRWRLQRGRSQLELRLRERNAWLLAAGDAPMDAKRSVGVYPGDAEFSRLARAITRACGAMPPSAARGF